MTVSTSGDDLLALGRALARPPLDAAINVLGLAVGFAVFLALLPDLRLESHLWFEPHLRFESGRHLFDPGRAPEVAGVGAAGLLGLILATLNYVGAATAPPRPCAQTRSLARAVAVLKALGATRALLLAWFVGEALADVAVASLVGLAMCELAAPLADVAGGLSLRVRYFGPDGLVAPLLAAVVPIGLAAGLSVGLARSRVQPGDVLAGLRPSRGRGLGALARETLVVIQFAVAIALTIATGVILGQTRHFRSADIGFRREGLIIVNSLDDSQIAGPPRASLLAAWRATPGVTSVAVADIALGADDNGASAGRTAGPMTLEAIQVGPDFFRTFGARLITGRLLDPRNSADEASLSPSSLSVAPLGAPPGGPPAAETGPPNVEINAAAALDLGFDSVRAAPGARLQVGLPQPTFLRVAGVIDDIRLRSPRDPAPPTLYAMTSHDFDGVAGVRFAGVSPPAMLARLRARWRQIVPGRPFRADTVEGDLEPYYRPYDRQARLMGAGAVLAMAIACMGLKGQASFTLGRRGREMAIRKALGASAGDILRRLVFRLLRPILLANLLAWPAAWVGMRSWLAGFDQRITLGPVYFVAAAAVALLIALATVAVPAIAGARAEPAAFRSAGVTPTS